MATSGTRTFNPQFAELLSESYSRIQIRGNSITQDHIDDAVSSANLLFIEMANRVQHQFQMQLVTIDTVQGQAEYDLPAGVIEVFKMVHRRTADSPDTDTPIWPMSRSDYLTIPDKDNEGRPFNYFMERGKVGNAQRTVTLWPVPDRDDDQIVLWGIYRPEDTSGLPDNIGIAWEWFDCYAAKLSARLAEKYAPEQWPAKSAAGEISFNIAKQADRERAPVRMKMRGYSRGRRRF